MRGYYGLEGFIRGRFGGIAERKIDGLDITVLSIITKDGHLNTIYSDGHNLGYSFGREVEVWRKIIDSKNFIVIVEQIISYRGAQGRYIVKEEYQEYP